MNFFLINKKFLNLFYYIHYKNDNKFKSILSLILFFKFKRN